MEYQLTNRLLINRPVTFLCGPYYDEDNRGDRRNILRENIHRVYSSKRQEVLPLIVDKFLTSNNLDYSEYNVQLIEEICAAISFQTHIFLDTMSAATELGIFTNSSYENDICVYIPKNEDTFNQGLVGYFVRNAVLKKPNANITTLEYHPRITKIAYSTVYTAEHFSFNGDKIPKNIYDLIEDKAANNKASFDCMISYLDMSKNPVKANNTISYLKVEDTLLISLPLRMLFYITASISIQENKHKEKDLCDSDIQELILIVKRAINRATCAEIGYTDSCFKNISISTDINQDIDYIIKHIIKFINIYYLKSQFKGYELVSHPEKLAFQIADTNDPNAMFNLTVQDCETIENIISSPNNFYEEFVLKQGAKRRSVVKYIDDINGLQAKSLHKKIIKSFKDIYEHSDYSFAYHEGDSIVKCINKHIESIDFLKFDISDFFGSISLERLADKFKNDYNISQTNISYLYKVLEACFYNGGLPIGLAASPTLSDYYMQDFDNKIGEFCINQGIVYTRYADDILISSKTLMNDILVSELYNLIYDSFAELGLSSNDKKHQHIVLGVKRNSIRYIGISIVRANGMNYLSVGKKYIRLVAKEYKEYKKLDAQKNTLDIKEEQLFYLRMKVIGKIDFVKHVEGDKGIARIKACLQNDYPNDDLSVI